MFVDRQVQGALLYRIAIYWCFAVLTVCLVTLCANAITYSGPADSILDYFAFQGFFQQYGIVVLASLVLVPIIMLDVVATSNRFVGPLYRMRRSMRALAAGEHVEPIQFREKDYWKDVAVEFNLVAEYVEQLQKELKQATARADEPRDFQTAAQ
jgi:signal transduction histidine kinase